MRVFLLLSILVIILPLVQGSIKAAYFNNTALTAPALISRVDAAIDFDWSNGTPLPAPFSAIWQGELSAQKGTYYTFGLEFNSGYVRLWVDDHLMIDGTGPTWGSTDSSYTKWEGLNIDTPGHSMKDDGGDCSASKCGSIAKCEALCETLVDKGCIGFVTDAGGPKSKPCYMRKLSKKNESCGSDMQLNSQFTTFTRNASCSFPPFPPVPVKSAKYAIPVPFFPNSTVSRIRLELTVGPHDKLTKLRLRVNASVGAPPTEIIPASALEAKVLPAEVQYFQERSKAEVGWNTWLSGDMLTHALLPHGVAIQLSFTDGTQTLSKLGNNGPKCNIKQFPAVHGLHAMRGQYTEISKLSFSGMTYRVESHETNKGELQLLITTLSSNNKTNGVAHSLLVQVDVPTPWVPRVCTVSTSSKVISAACPGFSTINLHPSNDTFVVSTDTGFTIALPVTVGDSIALSTGNIPVTTENVANSVSAARKALLKTFAFYGDKNETFAGMTTGISWNVIYTPYEGIFTPVFRGSPWDVSKPHNYVLFEWDTYFSAWIAAKIDPWVAKNNVIRMTKSLNKFGYVAGFWNGLCGEIDKSKPPVGGMVLGHLIEINSPQNMWIAELLIDQFVMWNRWWHTTRFPGLGLLAPGSTRSMYKKVINCVNQNPIGASRCETGLDNSPLYDGATFVTSVNVMNHADVGMSAMYARDCEVLANISMMLGKTAYVKELENRAKIVKNAIRTKLWDEENGLYFNKLWQTDTWAPKVAAPTNFYPMLTRIPTQSQVETMMSRWLTNTSEFCVNNSACPYGIPSVSRSSKAFNDNSYWRGRTWGPMNFLVYRGLQRYDDVPAAKAARKALAIQSENTFLVEWLSNHRVMENYNSVKGVGCDVGNAIPFYHWGALNALIPLIEAGYQ